MIEQDRVISARPEREDESLDRAVRPKRLADYIGQAAVNTLLPVGEVFFRHGIGQRKQRYAVLHFLEIGARPSPYFLRRALGRHQFRIFSLDCLELMVKRIKLGVGNLGFIEHVISKAMMLHQAPEFLQTLSYIRIAGVMSMISHDIGRNFSRDLRE